LLRQPPMREAQERGAPDAAGSQGNLLVVAHLGHCTQRVLDGAGKVDLAALNAMLSAHRASSSAKGFRTAAAQMRVFSTQLTAIMASVATIVNDLSGEVAQLRKRDRARRKLDAARANLVTDQTCLLKLLAALAASGAAARVRLREQQRRLALSVASSLRICDAGRNLARCALIEAVHAELMAEQLQQVATELADAVNGIIDLLKQMQAELRGIST